MDFRNACARPPEIVRSVQKDSNYVNELAADFSDLLRLTGSLNWVKYNNVCRLLAEVAYHGFASMNNMQTLGEEYTGIIQVDSNYKHIPARSLQLIAIMLEFGGESLYLKVLQKLERYIAEHEEMLPNVKKKLATVIQAMRNSPSYIKALHKSWFYMHSDKYQLSKRFTGINYVLIRHWLQPEFSLHGYKILGVITFLQVAVSLAITSFEVWRAQIRTLSAGNKITKMFARGQSSDSEVSYAPQCMLCLEPRLHTALTPCGHPFCWACIMEWMDERNECPLCRESIKKSNVILVQNYV